MLESISKEIKVPANQGYAGGTVLLATNDPHNHLNLYPDEGKCVQFTPETAKELRDILNDLYPATGKPEDCELTEADRRTVTVLLIL